MSAIYKGENPGALGALPPLDPHQGKQKTNKQKAKKSVPEEPSKWECDNHKLDHDWSV